MGNYKPKFAKTGQVNYAGQRGSTTIARPLAGGFKKNYKMFSLVALIAVSNLISHGFFNPNMGLSSKAPAPVMASEESPSLYLMDKAATYVPDEAQFEQKVREIAMMLDVPPEWLMAVMYSESKFDASVLNHKGSGATGLIQFMPGAASDMNISLQRLQRMSHLQQLEYVFIYLDKVRERYGAYESLTDLYLAILFPKARRQDPCYTLYAKPSKSYKQNSGLDENKDGRVTVSDIELRMQRLYPNAANATLGDAS